MGHLTLDSNASNVDDYYNGLKIVITNPSATGTIINYSGNERQITNIIWNNNESPITDWGSLYIW